MRGCLHGATTQGSVALVAGEAGIGKTSLLRVLAARHAGPVWWGACDALLTPHPLAPLLDIVRTAGPRFAPYLRGPRPALFDAVLDELSLGTAPLLMVVEDVHWADDATLDLLKFLGRRITRTRAVLAISFRDDEVGLAHPLRRVLGELSAEVLTRIDVPYLSPAAVESLARRAERSAAGVHAATRGNAFFVTEMLRDRGGTAVPRTVQDLVLARFARLNEPARELVQLASLVPACIERWLVDALLAPALADVQACINGGLLLADGASLSFRHELARVAVESSLSQPLTQSLHSRVLAALAPEPRQTAMARLVHHAVGARDHAAVSRFAPAAADQARERGAHREAAAHWRTALRDGAPADESQRQRWLEAYAVECQLTDQLAEAMDARRQLGLSYRRAGDALREAHNLSRSALVQVLALQNAQADEDSRRSIELLGPLPPCVEQAHAYWVQAQLRMLNRDCAESARWAGKAIDLAQRFDSREILAAARGTLGAALLFIDWDRGVAELQEALRMALQDGLHWVAANSYVNLGSAAAELFRLHEAGRWLRDAVDYAQRHEIDFYLHYATAWLALWELSTGRWDEAAVHALEASRRAGADTTSRVMALVALGRLRTRRGDPGAEEVLMQALALAERSGTLQRIAPVRAALAEWAWMGADPARADIEAAAALPMAQAHGHAWFIGELALWRSRAGALAKAPEGSAQPYTLEIDGRWREAAEAWQALGYPYERARVLAEGDEDAQLEALAVFDALGARPAADALRRRLRRAGVRGVARGARESTRNHPCGLTDAEMKVLALMCAALRNAEIAARLHRSVRTVDHHVAAVLTKLGVQTRQEAVHRAGREGWFGTGLGQSGQDGPAN